MLVSDLIAEIKRPSKGLHLIGAGVRELLSTPIESCVILERSAVICFLGQSNNAFRILNRNNAKVLDLRLDYKMGTDFYDIYESIASRVINEFKDNIVSIFMSGNPYFLNQISLLIENKANNLSIPFYSYSASSSLDDLIALITNENSVTSFQCVTAKTFLNTSMNIDPNETLFIFQIGAFAEKDDKKAAALRRSELNQLFLKLRSIFGISANWKFIRASVEPEDKHIVVKGRLRDLQTIFSVCHSGTLVIARSIN